MNHCLANENGLGRRRTSHLTRRNNCSNESLPGKQHRPRAEHSRHISQHVNTHHMPKLVLPNVLLAAVVREGGKQKFSRPPLRLETVLDLIAEPLLHNGRAAVLFQSLFGPTPQLPGRIRICRIFGRQRLGAIPEVFAGHAVEALCRETVHGGGSTLLCSAVLKCGEQHLPFQELLPPQVSHDHPWVQGIRRHRGPALLEAPRQLT
mmetsp:Transcript_80584/g.260514  ORF Transcript_80584/g.260514 Transcript_80584/m.260514 type:complete len:206 (+) Transcript_80584:117-734(+)